MTITLKMIAELNEPIFHLLLFLFCNIVFAYHPHTCRPILHEICQKTHRSFNSIHCFRYRHERTVRLFDVVVFQLKELTFVTVYKLENVLA
ncbi:hypothetical protein BCR42DRAFT_427157 [Absidia repens]|uniref:Uncharacterized protein n=1 Tax=Absidia repens TaxID=90262 RepID=A0A1X2I035_9FUNG|nr:hypothetical protein BCR42DRAFT_427157 [Absidia repens]